MAEWSAVRQAARQRRAEVLGERSGELVPAEELIDQALECQGVRLIADMPVCGPS